jgi:hypothetical protein
MTSTPSSTHPPGYSAQQAAVRDMMRRALEEDQYSALGVSTSTSRLLMSVLAAAAVLEMCYR